LRSTVSLDGIWTFQTDPYAVGVSQRWQHSTGFERRVEVPAAWQLYGPDLVAYAGHAWYHRAFEVPPGWSDGEVVVQFDAVDYEATVWLNGERVGMHEGGYTPFEFTLPHVRRDGLNHLVVRVWDPLDNAEIPHGKQGAWYTRVSGPWQPVRLLHRPAAHLNALRVTPWPQQEAVEVAIHATPGHVVGLGITDADGTTVAETTTASSHARLSIHHPRLWCPEDPHLYTLHAHLGDDAMTVHFGMRWIEVRDRLIHLNGHPYYIRGALDQAYWPRTIYTPGSVADIEAEIRQAQAMGINLLRKHIKLEDPRSLDACDRLGMLVWEEPACFSRWTRQARHRFEREIEAMIGRDYNHPSVIIWTLYNEEWGLEWTLRDDAHKQEHVAHLYEHARRLDPTRLVCDNSGWAHVRTDVNDFHRYHALPEQAIEWRHDIEHMVERGEHNFVASRRASANGAPVIVSEFGMWGLPEISRLGEGILHGHDPEAPRTPTPESPGTEIYYGRPTLASRPWWFDAQWAGHAEEFKYPVTAERNFHHFKLDRVFRDLDALGRACQHRMMRGLKATIEEMRLEPRLAGWVVTELSDIEWESNGWLDYYRRPKADAYKFGWFHMPLVVILRLERHNFWEGETVTVRPFVSNHSPRSGEATIDWRVGSSLSGSVPVRLEPWRTVEAETFTFEAPSSAGCVRSVLRASLLVEGVEAALNQEELTFTPRHPATPTYPLLLRHGARQLVGLPQYAEPGGAALLVTTELDGEALDHMSAGGRVLFMVERGDHTQSKGNLSFRDLAQGENWDRAASVMYWRPEKFPGLPCEPIMGWECEGIFPRTVVPISNYLHYFGGRGIEQASNQCNVDADGILAGYFEGWLGKFAATVLSMPYEAGKLTVSTFQLLETYGTHPIATLLLHALCDIARG
jgi:hypothetical protein